MSSSRENAVPDNAVSGRPRTPEDISALCDDALRRRMRAAAGELIDRYKDAVRGSTPEQQTELTRAMRRVRHRRAGVLADDRAGLTEAYWEFTELAIAPLPGREPAVEHAAEASAACG